jgi:hypothetical protein
VSGSGDGNHLLLTAGQVVRGRAPALLDAGSCLRPSRCPPDCGASHHTTPRIPLFTAGGAIVPRLRGRFDNWGRCRHGLVRQRCIGRQGMCPDGPSQRGLSRVSGARTARGATRLGVAPPATSSPASCRSEPCHLAHPHHAQRGAWSPAPPPTDRRLVNPRFPARPWGPSDSLSNHAEHRRPRTHRRPARNSRPHRTGH